MPKKKFKFTITWNITDSNTAKNKFKIIKNRRIHPVSCLYDNKANF